MAASSPASTASTGPSASPHRLVRVLRLLLDLRRGSDVDAMLDRVRGDVPVRGATVWVLVCSALLASLGLDTSSTAVVIGAMLISPLMAPILGVGLGVAAHDRRLLVASLRNLGIATGASLAASTVYFWLTPLGAPTAELLARTRPTLLDVGIAFVGGVAGIVATSRKEPTTVIPGVAIATALMPPICTAGFGLATGRWAVFAGAFYLFFLNAVFIAAATYLMARVLRVRLRATVPEKQQDRVERAILALVVASAVPATVILVDTVRDARLQSRAEHFVQQRVAVDGREVVRWSITGQRAILGDDQGTGELTVFLAGRGLRPGESDSLAAMLPGAGLGNHRLRLVSLAGPTDALTRDDLTTLFSTPPSAATAPSAPESATQTEAAPLDSLGLNRLTAEARVAVPSLDTLGIATGARFVAARPDTVPTVLARFDSTRGPDDLARLRRYLRVRLDVDTVRVAVF